MENVYTLSKNDLLLLELEPTNAIEYTISQSGWTGKFNNMHEVIENEYGSFKGELIITGEQLTDQQFDYIVKDCPHVEY